MQLLLSDEKDGVVGSQSAKSLQPEKETNEVTSRMDGIYSGEGEKVGQAIADEIYFEEEDLFPEFDSIIEMGEKELQLAESSAVMDEQLAIFPSKDVEEEEVERLVTVQEIAEDQNKDVFDEAVLGMIIIVYIIEKLTASSCTYTCTWC